MEQLLLHLFGDYVTQTDWMAENKTKNSNAALLHAIVYTLPFLLLKPSLLAVFVILSTHFVIDRWRLARYVIFAKNWLNNPSLQWADCSRTGYLESKPVWMTTWLMIITDNFFHLACNYASLRWL